MKNEGRIIIAGESSNKFHNGWVEAALESAIRNIIKLSPDSYEAEFGEYERDRYDGDDTCKIGSKKKTGGFDPFFSR